MQAPDDFIHDPLITKLKSINFEASPFDGNACEPIGVLLEKCPALEKLNLSRCG